MGDLVKKTPYSEITATLEILDQWGVNREHLDKFRGAHPRVHRQVAEAIISSEESFFVQKTVPRAVQPVLSFPPLQAVEKFEDWLTQVLEFERAYHLAFFGKEFDLAEFEATLKKYGPERIQSWLALDLEPHFLPKAAMNYNARSPGWKVKPERWFWNQLAAGKILRNRNGELVAGVSSVELEGVTVLIDTRLKPHYKNGKQMWEGDTLLRPILIHLREEKKIARYEYGTQDSRFGVSADEWEEYVKSALAENLGLGPNQIRLERTIEANVIPQLFSYMPRKDDSKTDTWVWHEEYFGDRSNRLDGGRSGGGGLACVRWCGARDRWSRRSFRPLAVL